MIYASIDIGSASVQLLVVKEDGQTLCDVSRDVGLGLGKSKAGMLPQERISLALVALQELVAIAAKHGIQPWEINSVATSDLGRAFNAKSVLTKIRDYTGLEPHILSHESEARFAWEGGTCGLKIPDGPVAVVNVGSSSIEAVMCDSHNRFYLETLRFGCVGLTEEYFGEQPSKYNMHKMSMVRDEIRQNTFQLQWPERPRMLVFLGGAAMAFATMELSMETHNPHFIHGHKMNRAQLRRWIDKLMITPPQARRDLCPAHVGKSDFLLVAACLMDSICEVSLRDSFVISAGGIRLGVLMQMAQ